MADDGVYRSRFETGRSNGGLTAFPGGDRWRWEDHHAVAGAADQAHVVLDKQHGLPLVGHAAEGDAEFF
jgi:Protein of unknown function (DUF3626)